jgi:hypothetical protein
MKYSEIAFGLLLLGFILLTYLIYLPIHHRRITMRFLILAFLICGTAHAQTTLTFTDGTVSGTVTVDSLVNGTNLYTPTDYSFNAPNTDMLSQTVQTTLQNEQSSADVGGIFQFTVSNGVVTAWSVQVGAGEGHTADEHYNENLLLTNTGDSYSTVNCDGTCVNTGGTVAAGTWTPSVHAQVAPEISGSSAITALTMLGFGIAVLRGRKSALAPS